MSASSLFNRSTSLKKIILFLSLIFWGVFFILYWSQAYFVKDGFVYAKSLGMWADGSAHLTYISALSFQPHFPRYLPTFVGMPFIYPFVADGFSALLVRSGLNIFSSYTVVGLTLSLFLLTNLFRFYSIYLGNKNTAVIAINLFLASGGLGFIYFFFDIYNQGWELIWSIPKEYTRLDHHNIWWLNIITGEIIPQRPLLLGLVIGLAILTRIYQYLIDYKSHPGHFFLIGIIMGIMPIIHPHTVIALVPCLGFAFFYDLLQKRTFNKHWFWMVAPALIVGIPIVFQHILTNTGTNFVQFKPGWLAATNHLNWFWFWFKNWGVFPIISFLGFFKLSKIQRWFQLPFIFLFALSNLVWFQPYDWDNSKVLTWSYLAFSPLAAHYLFSIWQRTFTHKSLAITFFFIMTLSGYVDVVRQLQPHVSIPMYSLEDIQLAEFIKSHTSPDSIFLTSDLHTHPISTLTGRQILMGYRGWLWSYGINYSLREKQISIIYQGGESALELINDFNIDYIVISHSEKERFLANPAFFKQHFSVFYQSPNYLIYQVD